MQSFNLNISTWIKKKGELYKNLKRLYLVLDTHFNYANGHYFGKLFIWSYFVLQ